MGGIDIESLAFCVKFLFLFFSLRVLMASCIVDTIDIIGEINIRINNMYINHPVSIDVNSPFILFVKYFVRYFVFLLPSFLLLYPKDLPIYRCQFVLLLLLKFFLIPKGHSSLNNLFV